MRHLPINPLDWIYPPRCMACRNIIPIHQRTQRARFLCDPCKALFVPLAPPVCARCGCPVPAEGALCVSCIAKEPTFTSNFAAFAYEDLIRELIHEMKFRNKKHIATGLGALLAEIYTANEERHAEAFDLLVPVPMHPRKQKKRGFNQAAILAETLSEILNIPAVKNLLLRTRNTPPQSGLTLRQRAENMHGAFKLREDCDIQHKKIGLIDDIYTTGATLDACARVLLRGGAASVYGITLSVAIKNNN